MKEHLGNGLGALLMPFVISSIQLFFGPTGSRMTLGMSAFGLPMGLALSTATDNFGLLGVGLPIGMVIGMAMGTGMDKKAKEEGRQLEIG